MAIDDPLDQVHELNEIEKAHENPAKAQLRKVLAIGVIAGKATKLLPGIDGLAAITTLAEVAKELFAYNARENQDLMLKVIESEVRYLRDKLQELGKEHRDFIEQEWPELVVDGLRRATIARGKEKVAYLAFILANSAKEGPACPADDVEEMLKIAVDLTARELQVLKEFVRVQGGFGLQRWTPLQPMQAYEQWTTFNWSRVGFADAEVEGICNKLQGLGLISRIDPPNNQNMLGRGMPRFVLVRKGLQFYSFLKSTPPET